MRRRTASVPLHRRRDAARSAGCACPAGGRGAGAGLTFSGDRGGCRGRRSVPAPHPRFLAVLGGVEAALQAGVVEVALELAGLCDDQGFEVGVLDDAPDIVRVERGDRAEQFDRRAEYVGGGRPVIVSTLSGWTVCLPSLSPRGLTTMVSMPVASRFAAVRMSPSASGSAHTVNTSSPTRSRTSSGSGLPL